MIFVLTMLFTFVYDCKNENHWLLLTTRCLFTVYIVINVTADYNI